MPQDDEKPENVVNLADARRRQRTVQKQGANGRMPKNGTDKGKGKGKGQPLTGGKKIWSYVQFILFLAVVAYFMQLCRSGA